MTDYIEKQLTLTIQVPATFNGTDERALNRAIADLIANKGYELLDSKAYETVNQFIFDEELCVEDKTCECVDGYLWATGALVSRLRESIQDEHTPDELASISNPNFYFSHNLFTGNAQIIATYNYINSKNEQCFGSVDKLSISLEETEQIKKLMDEYCHEKYSMSCSAFLNEARFHAGFPPMERTVSIPVINGEEVLHEVDVKMDELLPEHIDERIHIYRDNKEDDSRLYDNLLFWSDSCGELEPPHGSDKFDPSGIPQPLQRAFRDLYSDEFCSHCYLVETPGGYGVALINEYDCVTATNFNLSPRELFEAVLRDAQRLSDIPEFDQVREIYATESYGPAGGELYHELVVVFPADMDKDAFRAAALRLDAEVYTGVREYSARKQEKLQASVDKLVTDAQSRTAVRSNALENRDPARTI